MKDGILTGGKKNTWRAEGVRKILLINDGTYAQQYYVQNRHPQLFRRTLHASTERI